MVNRTLSLWGRGLSPIRILVQRCSGLQRFMFLTGLATALPHRTLLGLNLMPRLKCLVSKSCSILSRILFTSRIRTLFKALPYIIRSRGLLLLSWRSPFSVVRILVFLGSSIRQSSIGLRIGILSLCLVLRFLFGCVPARLAMVYIRFGLTVLVSAHPMLEHSCSRPVPLLYGLLLVLLESRVPIPSLLLAMCSYARCAFRLLRDIPNIPVLKVLSVGVGWAQWLTLLSRVLMSLSVLPLACCSVELN